MKTYKVFSHPIGHHEVVKQGWSWPAFFFNAIWALVKKMWLIGIGLIALIVVLTIIEGMMQVSSVTGEVSGISMSINILVIIVSFVFGMNGNKWREKNLLIRGYDYKDTINAKNPEAALALWMK